MSAQAPSFEERIADVIVAAMKMAVKSLEARMSVIEAKSAAPVDRGFEARLKALEDRPALVYGGTYESGVTYVRGALVTRNGGLWLAKIDTSSTPGSNPDAWKLIVKSGGA